MLNYLSPQIFVMEFNLNNIVRSVAIVAVGLPMSLGINGFMSASTDALKSSTEVSAQSAEYDTLRAKLTGPCLKYLFSKVDSKLERNSKNTIDESFGGEVDYKGVCNWVIQ
jgi:hypothetical protein